MSDSAAARWEIDPPRWMSRAQKARFRALVLVRKEAQAPLSAGDLDLLGDYIAARSRVDALRTLWKNAIAGTAGEYANAQDDRRAIAIARQMDATAKLSRRLALDLRITEARGNGAAAPA